MTSPELELHRDLCRLVMKHVDWLDDEEWLKACNAVGAAYFSKIARQYEALDRFIEAMKIDHIDEESV